MTQVKFRAGDVVKHERKIYVVSSVKGWIHKGGGISLRQTMEGLELLTRASECTLVKRREEVGKKWWLVFPKGEK